MFQRVTQLLRGRLVQNAIALYGVTIANAILPLVTVPYLARVLRPDAWGMVLFAQTVAIWLAMLMEYGFVYSATREVARHVGQPEKLRQIVAEVMASKMALGIVAALAGVVLWWSVPAFHQNVIFFFGAVWLAVAQGFSPLWYFQGIERMRLPALLEVGCRVIYTVAVFFCIKAPEDAARVVIYQAISVTLSLGICLWLMYRDTGMTACSLKRTLGALREGWHFFLFVAVVNLYSKANSFLLGLLTGPATVSFYGGPERLMRGFLSFTGPINQVLYPRLSHLVKSDLLAAWKTVRRGTLTVGALGVLLGLTLTLGAPWLVQLLFGSGYERAVPVLRVLGFVCPFSAINSLMGIRWMFPLGLEREYNRVVMTGAALDVVLVMVLTPWQKELGVAWALLSAEVFIAATVFVVLWHKRLNPFQSWLQQRVTAP
jgi:polysaccharide transporter, PST family